MSSHLCDSQTSPGGGWTPQAALCPHPTHTRTAREPAPLLQRHLSATTNLAFQTSKNCMGGRLGSDWVNYSPLFSLIRSAELAPGKFRRRNADTFQDKAQLLEQQNGRCLKSLPALSLYSTRCIVLRSLPVLSCAVDNMDFFFLLNLFTPPFNLCCYC